MWMYPRYASGSNFSLLGRICTGGTGRHHRQSAGPRLLSDRRAVRHGSCASPGSPASAGQVVRRCIEESRDQTHAPAAAHAHSKRGSVTCHRSRRTSVTDRRVSAKLGARRTEAPWSADRRPCCLPWRRARLSARCRRAAAPQRRWAGAACRTRCVAQPLHPPAPLHIAAAPTRSARSPTWDAPAGVWHR